MLMRNQLHHLMLLFLLTACGGGLQLEQAAILGQTPIREETGAGIDQASQAQVEAQADYDAAGLLAGPGSGFIVLDNPAVVSAAQATWLSADELVLGVAWNGEARAYPISQMAYHHIANDVIGGKPFLVTY